jgi:transcriptional regulator with XRE-family HTH domain
MAETIVSQLIKRKNELGISVPKLAKLLTIPADRIYKWEQGKGEPKTSDRDKIVEWLENPDKVPDAKRQEHEQDTPPIWQIVLNLTYIGKRDSDSMNTMAATNQRNTDIIAALVSTLLPNSGLAEKLTASLAGSHTPDDLPAEHFVGGTDALKDALSKQQQAGKEKVKHK